MKTFFILVVIAGAVTAHNSTGTTGPGNMGNISTIQAAMNFLQNNGINPGTLVYSSCVNDGDHCTPGDLPCCFSPIYTCQPWKSSGRHKCLLPPGLRNQTSSIRQIYQMFGVVTENPIQ